MLLFKLFFPNEHNRKGKGKLAYISNTPDYSPSTMTAVISHCQWPLKV